MSTNKWKWIQAIMQAIVAAITALLTALTASSCSPALVECMHSVLTACQ